MNLREQLDDYVVTTVPSPPALSLVWAEADDTAEMTAEPEGTLTVLAEYRVSRVPGTRAS